MKKEEVFRFVEDKGFRMVGDVVGGVPTAIVRIIGPDGELSEQVSEGSTEMVAVTTAVKKALSLYLDWELLNLGRPGVKLERPEGKSPVESVVHIWLTGRYRGDFTLKGDARDALFAKAYGLSLLALCSDAWKKERKREQEWLLAEAQRVASTSAASV